MIKNGSFEDWVFETKHGVHDCTINGKCSGCGDCCSNILPLMKKEIIEIKKYIKEHDIKRQEHRSFFLSADTIDMVCPFCDINKELKCTIYPVRPSICKIFLCSNAAKRNVHLSDAGRRDINMREVFFGKGVNRIFEKTMAPEMKAAMKRADEALIEMINKTEKEGK